MHEYVRSFNICMNIYRASNMCLNIYGAHGHIYIYIHMYAYMYTYICMYIFFVFYMICIYAYVYTSYVYWVSLRQVCSNSVSRVGGSRQRLTFGPLSGSFTTCSRFWATSNWKKGQGSPQHTCIDMCIQLVWRTKSSREGQQASWNFKRAERAKRAEES